MNQLSQALTKFLKRNEIQYMRIPTYHPASNRAAERDVQKIKNKKDSPGRVLDEDLMSPFAVSHDTS